MALLVTSIELFTRAFENCEVNPDFPYQVIFTKRCENTEKKLESEDILKIKLIFDQRQHSSPWANIQNYNYNKTWE